MTDPKEHALNKVRLCAQESGTLPTDLVIAVYNAALVGATSGEVLEAMGGPAEEGPDRAANELSDVDTSPSMVERVEGLVRASIAEDWTSIELASLVLTYAYRLRRLAEKSKNR